MRVVLYEGAKGVRVGAYEGKVEEHEGEGVSVCIGVRVRV